MKIVMGDFNSKGGEIRLDRTAGPYGLAEMNEGGDN